MKHTLRNHALFVLYFLAPLGLALFVMYTFATRTIEQTEIALQVVRDRLSGQ